MAIKRIGKGKAERIDYDPEQDASRERSHDDPDLAWTVGGNEHAVYLLDEGESFDPQTSSRGRHTMFGPSLIVRSVSGMQGCRTDEHYVNDPRIWAWIGRSIAEGHLSAETITSVANEREVEFA